MPMSREKKVENLEQRRPVFARPDATLRAVAHTMWVENIGALVVGDEQRPIGIISERDLVARIGQGDDLDAVTAGEAMPPYLVTVRVGDTLDDAAYQMLNDNVRHLPLVDQDGRVVGMVSLRDLVRPLLAGGTVDSE